MSFTNFIATRYLKADRQNRFFSWISILSVVGIAIGVSAMIVVLSVINAFEHELRERFLAANAHILLYRLPAGLVDYPLWMEKLEQEYSEEIKASAPFVYYETMAKNDSFMQPALVRGIIPSQREKVQPLSKLVKPKGALEELESYRPGTGMPPIIIGNGLLGLLGAEIGSHISLVSPTESSTRSFKKFRVVGTYNSGMKHYDNKIGWMPLNASQEFFAMGDKVTGLEIGLKNPTDGPKVALKLEEMWPNLSIKDWTSFNRPIFEAMEVERMMIAIIVALVALVASFNILTTMFVAVTQKQRDISILKSLGATNRKILSIFVTQGGLMAVVGSALGVILAVVLSEIIKNYEIVKLPDIYLLSRLPVEYDWRVYSSVALASVALAMLASLGPAIIATKVSPTTGLRRVV